MNIHYVFVRVVSKSGVASMPLLQLEPRAGMNIGVLCCESGVVFISNVGRICNCYSGFVLVLIS